MIIVFIWTIIWLALVGGSILTMKMTDNISFKQICRVIAFWLIWPFTLIMTIVLYFSTPSYLRNQQLIQLLTMDID